ncbi:MAG: ligase, partial [Pseudomonadota bacterium]
MSALDTYRAKRDFARTPEPSGEAKTAPGQRFVVQKHAATRLHYDFRLELDGVLVSWAVTRGPSANPDDKRLAVRTEDHPIDYAGFEGTIPKREYGGGTVMLWDNGTWEPVPGKDPRQTLADGHLHVILHGQRMRGEWILVRLKPKPGEKRENWLLRKVEDAFAGGSDDLTGTHLTSVESGRTLDEIAAGTKGKKAHTSVSAPPAFRPVQLATLVDHVPAGDSWLHEVKYDGYRTLIAIGGGTARAYTRSWLDWSDKFADLVADAAKLTVDTALIDGEAVVFRPDGRTNFQALQSAIKAAAGRIDYVAFDLLMIDGEDLTRQPLEARKARLAALIGEGAGHIRYSDHIVGKGELLLERFCATGLEGVISKRAGSPYAGTRNGNWLKTKCSKREALAIVGWLPSEKARGFRSLLLGRDDGGVLRYAGKVGTGFGADEMARLEALLAPLATDTPTVEAPKAAVRGARWVK